MNSRDDLRHVTYLNQNYDRKPGYFHRWYAEVDEDGTTSLYGIIEDENGNVLKINFRDITFIS